MNKFYDYRLLAVSEAANLLSIAVKTLRNWTSQGKIPYVKINGATRYKLKDLINWIEENTIKT